MALTGINAIRLETTMMNSITMENFRCFRERQTVRLAPLTLLVGENSTGKTSFLALVRALAEAVSGLSPPDFEQAPFDLGSFDDIVHGGVVEQRTRHRFDAEVITSDKGGCQILYSFSFGKLEYAPYPLKRCFSGSGTRIVEKTSQDGDVTMLVGTDRGLWDVKFSGHEFGLSPRLGGTLTFRLLEMALINFSETRVVTGIAEMIPVNGSPPFTNDDAAELDLLLEHLIGMHQHKPFASAAIRSKPQRSYNHTRPAIDPEGQFAPLYLADVAATGKASWAILKEGIEAFGNSAGLFDELRIRRWESESDPFQVQVRRIEDNGDGVWRNLVDVGYGVNQALPVITELLREIPREITLLQQPEVHLHPKAQAALGTLFCQVAGSGNPNRQLIVETHSDHLINRVRMDVRDGVTDLRPEDVMVLYFERNGPEVKIHEVTFDSEGNVDAPSSYGRFFMNETRRNLWPEDYAAKR